MKKIALVVMFTGLIFGCQNSPQIVKEPWVEKPVSLWPDFTLSNEIGFNDTTYYDLGNSFLVNTGFDTIGISCKHLFMVFENQLGMKAIDLGVIGSVPYLTGLFDKYGIDYKSPDY